MTRRRRKGRKECIHEICLSAYTRSRQDVVDPVKIAEEVMKVKFVDNREDPVDVVEEVVGQVIEGTEDKEDKEFQ